MYAIELVEYTYGETLLLSTWPKKISQHLDVIVHMYLIQQVWTKVLVCVLMRMQSYSFAMANPLKKSLILKYV